MKRCAFCGRTGSAGFTETTAISFDGRSPRVTLCKASRACWARRLAEHKARRAEHKATA